MVLFMNRVLFLYVRCKTFQSSLLAGLKVPSDVLNSVVVLPTVGLSLRVCCSVPLTLGNGSLIDDFVCESVIRGLWVIASSH